MYKLLIIDLLFFFLAACSSDITEEQNEQFITKNKESNILVSKKSAKKKVAPLLIDSKTKVQVYLNVKSTDENSILRLKEFGVEIQIVNTKLKKIQALVDSDKLDELKILDNVNSITEPSYGHLR